MPGDSSYAQRGPGKIDPYFVQPTPQLEREMAVDVDKAPTRDENPSLESTAIQGSEIQRLEREQARLDEEIAERERISQLRLEREEIRRRLEEAKAQAKKGEVV